MLYRAPYSCMTGASCCSSGVGWLPLYCEPLAGLLGGCWRKRLKQCDLERSGSAFNGSAAPVGMWRPSPQLPSPDPKNTTLMQE